MAVDRVGCGGKTDGEVEDGSSDMDTDQEFCCQSSDMDIDQKLSRILLLKSDIDHLTLSGNKIVVAQSVTLSLSARISSQMQCLLVNHFVRVLYFNPTHIVEYRGNNINRCLHWLPNRPTDTHTN